jgi:predicted dehydrogenase
MALKVALIGAGRVATIHMQALAQTDAVDLVGIFDQDRERAGEQAPEYGVQRVYKAWDAC